MGRRHQPGRPDPVELEGAGRTLPRAAVGSTASELDFGFLVQSCEDMTVCGKSPSLWHFVVKTARLNGS